MDSDSDDDFEVAALTLVLHQRSRRSRLHRKKRKHWLKAEDCFPARFKGVHFINQPWYVRLLMTVTRPIMKQKAQNRLYYHGKGALRLHNYIPPSVLPPDLCGDMSVPDKLWLYKALLDRELNKQKR